MSIKTAIIFSGQGAQYSGMGQKWIDTPCCRAVFDAAGPDAERFCLEASADELSRTVRTQPAVYTMDTAIGAAVSAALEEHGLKADAVAGFSLGEYAALAYAGGYDFNAGLRLVTERGNLMEEAGRGKGSMAAVLGDREVLIGIIAGLNCDFLLPVNFNCPGQTVVSGDSEALAALAAKCGEHKLRFAPLNVSGPFHSPVMAGVADKLFETLSMMPLGELKLPVYGNLDAKPYSAGEIPVKLAAQVKSPVLWDKTLKNMYDDGIRLFIEAGPGKTLTGFVKRTLPDAIAISADSTKGYEALRDMIGGNINA